MKIMNIPCIVCGSTEKGEIILHSLPLFKCLSCGLVWRRTFDVPLSHYEEAGSGSSISKREARLRNARDRVKTFSRYGTLQNVCDVGTGDGIFVEALHEAGLSGVGIEPGKEPRKEAEEHGVRIVGSTFEDVPKVAAEEHTQTLSLFHVIEHVDKPREMLEAFFEALPSGGSLIVETPNLQSFVFRAKGYEDELIYPAHLHYFNEQNLRMLLEDVGFTVRASGRREFDQYNLPIRESLRRLGLLHYPKQESGAAVDNADVGEGPPLQASWARSLVRKLLAQLVIRTGRLQYMWFIAEKP